MTSTRSVADSIGRARARGVTLRADEVPIAPADAYAIQRLRTAERLARGERVVGWKLGYTSAAMREAMGIQERNLGALTDRMVLASPARTPTTLLQPRVEPEVAVRVDAGGRVVSRHLALEVVDSVWEEYRFTWAHNTADESSAALAVLDESRDLPSDLTGLSVVLTSSSGEEVRADLADALPDIDDAVTWLAEQLDRAGGVLEAGSLVLTGGLTRPLPLVNGGAVWATIHDVADPGRAAAAVRVERP